MCRRFGLARMLPALLVVLCLPLSAKAAPTPEIRHLYSIEQLADRSIDITTDIHELKALKADAAAVDDDDHLYRVKQDDTHTHLLLLPGSANIEADWLHSKVVLTAALLKAAGASNAKNDVTITFELQTQVPSGDNPCTTVTVKSAEKTSFTCVGGTDDAVKKDLADAHLFVAVRGDKGGETWKRIESVDSAFDGSADLYKQLDTKRGGYLVRAGGHAQAVALVEGSKSSVQCTDPAVREHLRGLFSDLSKAPPQDFKSAYKAAEDAWEPYVVACGVTLPKDDTTNWPDEEIRTKTQLAGLGGKSNFDIAFEILHQAPMEAHALLESLLTKTTDADLGAVRTEATAVLVKAEAAFTALSSVEDWKVVSCPSWKFGEESFNDALGTLQTSVPNTGLHQLNADGMVDICKVRFVLGTIRGTATLRSRISQSLCGGFDANGNRNTWCGTYGVSLGALSQVWFLSNSPAGSSSGHMVSVAVPYIGVRFIPFENVQYIAFDVVAYSAYFTTNSLGNPPTPTPCTAGTSALDKALPCELNPQIKPYGAVGLGVTVGSKNTTFVTLSPVNFGWAAVGSQGVHPFFGVNVSAVSLTGTL